MSEVVQADFRPPQKAGQATMVEQARAVAEVRAALLVAMERPRDKIAAIAEMREVCGIMSLAERAFFRVQRGTEHVDGESIHLARELARCWGNIQYGVKELERDDVGKQSVLVAFCWDMQTNDRSEITFIVPHRRDTRKGSYDLTRTQEVYENNASFAGRRLREVIFAVLPVWFKAEASEICRRTLETGGEQVLAQRVANLRRAFESLGVSAAQLERKRGRRIDEFTGADVGALRVVYGSLSRNEVSLAEEFPPDEDAGDDAFQRASRGGKSAVTDPSVAPAVAGSRAREEGGNGGTPVIEGEGAAGGPESLGEGASRNDGGEPAGMEAGARAETGARGEAGDRGGPSDGKAEADAEPGGEPRGAYLVRGNNRDIEFPSGARWLEAWREQVAARERDRAHEALARDLTVNAAHIDAVRRFDPARAEEVTRTAQDALRRMQSAFPGRPAGGRAGGAR